MIGLEVNAGKLGQYWPYILLAIAVVLIVRAVVVVISGWVLRVIHRPIPNSWQTVMIWGGLRGSLALAMALSLPFSLDTRDLLQVMTFGVILFSLLVQALTMKPLLSKLGLIRSKDWQEEFETIAVRKGMAATAIAEIGRMATAGGLAPEEAEEMRRVYSEQINRQDEALRSMHLRDEDLRHEQLRSLKRKLLQLEKMVVRQRYSDGAISEEPMRRLLAELDEQMHALDEGAAE